MSVSQELCDNFDYFHELVQPLPMFQKLREEIVTKFEEIFILQNWKIDELEERVSFQENTTNQLLIKCDYNEQCSQRNCLSIHGIESKKMKK